jgi:hypothetical protein
MSRTQNNIRKEQKREYTKNFFDLSRESRVLFSFFFKNEVISSEIRFRYVLQKVKSVLDEVVVSSFNPCENCFRNSTFMIIRQKLQFVVFCVSVSEQNFHQTQKHSSRFWVQWWQWAHFNFLIRCDNCDPYFDKLQSVKHVSFVLNFFVVILFNFALNSILLAFFCVLLFSKNKHKIQQYLDLDIKHKEIFRK